MSQHEPDLFQGMGPPPLPADLKHRVLTRARQAARNATHHVTQPQPSLTDRLWESHRLRLAWAAMMILLLSAHLVLAGSMQSSTGPPSGDPPAGRITGTDPDLAPFLARHRVRETSDKLRLGGSQLLLLRTNADPFA